MKKSKNGYDEMQKERRNSIGHQMFMFLTFALFLNNGLHGMRITWLPYPSNVMIIVTACLGIYLVRLIAANAYLPAKVYTKKMAVRTIITILFSVTLAISLSSLLPQVHAAAENTSDNSAVILAIISIVGLLCALITAAIKKARSKEDNDD